MEKLAEELAVEKLVAQNNQINWRVPAIDGVRALAMLLVYGYHVWVFAGQPDLFVSLGGLRINTLGAFRNGFCGVDLFMVLSGFCLFLPLCKTPTVLDKWDTRKYFVRRIRRIVPPYYAAIAYTVLLPQVLVLFFRLLHQEAAWQPFPSLWQFITHLLFIHTLPFAPFVETWAGLSGPFWSLGLEAQFYVVFPLVVWGFAKYRFYALGAMGLVSIIYNILVPLFLVSPTNPVPHLIYNAFFLGRWMQFACGMAAAWITAQHWKAEHWHSAYRGTVALLAAIGLYMFSVSGVVASLTQFPFRELILGVAFSVAILALCITRSPLRSLVENRAMERLGFISYSVFLIHQPTTWFLSEMMKKKLGLEGISLLFFLCTLGFILVIGLSFVFFTLFERPFLNSASTRQPVRSVKAL